MDARQQGWIRYARWASLALIVASFLLFIRALPVDQVFDLLQVWIQGLGLWGPAIFALVYAVAATIFLPASALTLVAGAIFGLAIGTATVWVGATLTVALSFLIARYFARSRVEQMAKNNPKFGAIDKALGEEGWKIVALMRLSPAFPFNVQNYLYGVSSIRFWPCLIASSIFMLPGTFMYVYFGYIGGQAAAAASGGGAGTARLVLQGVGLAATVLVTLYITKVASKAIKKHTVVAGERVEETAPEAKPPPSASSAVVFAAISLVLFSSALYAYQNRAALQGWLLPPEVALSEAYDGAVASATFDHDLIDGVLREYVDGSGFVAYDALHVNSASLDAYIANLADAPFDRLGRDGKLVLLINAYNAFTLRLILDHYPLDSIESIPTDQRWEAARWKLFGGSYSLNQIEHELIRPNFSEPRIHFALVCAAIGCPPLRNEAYSTDRLEQQLADQAAAVHRGPRWFSYKPGADQVSLTQLYSWYAGDFEQVHGSVLAAAAEHSPALRQSIAAGKNIKIRWLDYDWSLNEQTATNAAPTS